MPKSHSWPAPKSSFSLQKAMPTGFLDFKTLVQISPCQEVQGHLHLDIRNKYWTYILPILCCGSDLLSDSIGTAKTFNEPLPPDTARTDHESRLREKTTTYSAIKSEGQYKLKVIVDTC